MSKKKFVTFGGPSQKYYDGVKRICGEAELFDVFDEIIGETDEHLKNDKLFWENHGKFIENNSRGYGYWMWKSYIVKKQIEKMDVGDILVYADAGCVLNINGKERLQQYFCMMENNEKGILTFRSTHKEETWTKMDTFNYFNASELHNTNQLIGTVFIIKKNEDTVRVVNDWYNACCNYHLIDDTPSDAHNYSSFRENRHDQSLWSIINKQYGSIQLDDETYFVDWKNCEKYPFLAKRQL